MCEYADGERKGLAQVALRPEHRCVARPCSGGAPLGSSGSALPRDARTSLRACRRRHVARGWCRRIEQARRAVRVIADSRAASARARVLRPIHPAGRGIDAAAGRREAQLDRGRRRAARVPRPPLHLERFLEPVLGVEHPAEVVVRARGRRHEVVLQRDREAPSEQDPRLVRATGKLASRPLLLSAARSPPAGRAAPRCQRLFDVGRGPFEMAVKEEEASELARDGRDMRLRLAPCERLERTLEPGDRPLWVPVEPVELRESRGDERCGLRVARAAKSACARSSSDRASAGAFARSAACPARSRASAGAPGSSVSSAARRSSASPRPTPRALERARRRPGSRASLRLARGSQCVVGVGRRLDRPRRSARR